MAEWLIVMEAHSNAPTYLVVLDVLERRLGARRLLRTAWVLEAASPEAIANSLQYYRPYDDGLLILPFTEPRVAYNLRDAAGRRPAPTIYRPTPAGDQATPE